MVLLFAFGVMLYFLRSFLKAHELLLSAVLLITLLVSPYLYNYDFCYCSSVCSFDEQ
jgi:hypothetical protein